jgi:hypothetical protein
MAQAERRKARGREHRKEDGKRARAQEGASTGGREHRRQAERRAHGWVAQGNRKQLAKFAGKTAEVPEFLSRLRVHLQGTVILFMINVIINPQTTCKLPANVNSGLPNTVNNADQTINNDVIQIGFHLI